MIRIVLIIVIYICFLKLQLGYCQQEIFLSPDGNDSNNGTIEFPLFSFDEAIRKANAIWKTENTEIIIYFRKGIYRITSPITLSSDVLKNRSNSLIISGYKNEKPVLSGGIQLTNWVTGNKDIYECSIGDLRFRQVYRNDSRAIRARDPDICSYSRLSWDTINNNIIIPGSIKKFKSDANNPTELIVQKIWAGQIFRVKNIFSYPGYNRINLISNDQFVFNKLKHQIKDQQSFHLENNFDFLDSDNEWYLDPNKQILYYYSENDSFFDSKIEVPILKNLIIIEGSEEININNITVQNLTLELTNNIYADTMGYFVGQANFLYSQYKQLEDGVILVKDADNVKINNNEIRKFGGTGIMLYENVHNSSISNNLIHTGSGNGIVVDWLLKQKLESARNCRDIIIKNNVISNIGQDYYGSVAIFSGYSDSVKIESNIIANVPYTGISVGWGHTDSETNLKNNVIKYNYIDNAMTLMSDGGGIYTLSNQPGTIIENNYIENLIKSKWSWGGGNVFGIYLDEGSDHMSVKYNLIRNTAVDYVVNAERNNIIWINSPFDIKNFKKNNYLYNNLDSLRIWTYSEQICTRNDNNLILFPNPIKNDFYIKFYDTYAQEFIDYNIYAKNGICVSTGTLVKRGNSIYSGRIENLTPDIYFLQLSLINGDKSIRIIYN